MARRLTTTALLAAALTLAGAALAGGSAPPATTAQDRETGTQLVSQTPEGNIPNGPSTNAVISGDRRYARVIAFESEASDLVARDTNGHKDVFAVRRAGSFGNNGSPWRGGNAILLSRGRRGPANGPSFSPAVDGNFRNPGRCVAFLSQASNLVPRDTNRRTDAFLSRGPGGAPRRVSVTGRGRQLRSDSTAVAVAGNCSAVAFVAGGRLYVRRGSRTTRIRRFRGRAEDPSFAQGEGDRDLVFAAGGSVYLLRGGRGRPRKVGEGTNPAYNGIRRQVVAYEQRRGENTQIVARDIGRRERLVSSAGGREGDGSSRNPVVVNSGFYVAFESDASNLQTDANGRFRDNNGQPDVYLYTDVRDITLIESVSDDDRVLPGGGRRPSPSFYANYIVFDSPAPPDTVGGPPQVFLHYLGPR